MRGSEEQRRDVIIVQGIYICLPKTAGKPQCGLTNSRETVVFGKTDSPTRDYSHQNADLGFDNFANMLYASRHRREHERRLLGSGDERRRIWPALKYRQNSSYG